MIFIEKGKQKMQKPNDGWQKLGGVTAKIIADLRKRLDEKSKPINPTGKGTEMDEIAELDKLVDAKDARITELEAENAKLKAALYDTRKSAALLLQSVETANYEWLQDAPGWLVDCRKSIDNAADLLKDEPTNAELDLIAPF